MDKVGGGKGRFIIFTALSLVIAGTVFLLANNFKPSVYTVTFKTDADTVFFLYENVWEGRLIAEPETPVREHYVFGGWYSDAGFAKEWDFDSRTVSRDTTLYARWEPKKYVVTFFDGNVALYGSQQFLEYNETAAAPAVAFTRRGYDFGGWYNENGEEWDFADGITGDLDLRAGWTPKSFRVIFMDGDEPIDAADAEYDSLLPALKIAPTPPEGKYLAGWETEDGTLVDLDAPYTLTDGSAPLTLYASYRDKIYGVSFYDYGADGKYAMYASSGVVHGRTVAEPETPERNADFSGWFDGDAEWDFNTAITGDLTLCARWSAGVSYEGYGANDTVVPLWTVLNNFFTPVETGYSFIGWFTDAELQSAWDFGEPVTGHITLYAKFDINRYTLKFISGGEVYAAQTVAYGEKPVLPPNPEDEVFDYNYFGGWYLDEAYTEPLTDEYTMGEGDVSVYALWWNESNISLAPDKFIVRFYYYHLVALVEERYATGNYSDTWYWVTLGYTDAFIVKFVRGDEDMQGYDNITLIYEAFYRLIDSSLSLDGQ